MAIVDQFIPNPPIRCPLCSEVIVEWQGAGLMGLFEWRQHVASPVAQHADETVAVSEQELQETRLDEDQFIHGYECKCEQVVHAAIARVADGVWVGLDHYAVISNASKFAKTILLWPERRSWRGEIEDTDRLIRIANARNENQ